MPDETKDRLMSMSIPDLIYQAGLEDRYGNQVRAQQCHAAAAMKAQTLYAAARVVVSHWNEFGPQHGFEELLSSLEKELSQPPPVAPPTRVKVIDQPKRITVLDKPKEKIVAPPTTPYEQGDVPWWAKDSRLRQRDTFMKEQLARVGAALAAAERERDAARQDAAGWEEANVSANHALNEANAMLDAAREREKGLVEEVRLALSELQVAYGQDDGGMPDGAIAAINSRLSAALAAAGKGEPQT